MALPLDRAPDHRLDVCALREVGDDRMRSAADGIDLSGDLSSAPLVEVSDHDIGAFARERDRRGAADPIRRTGNEGNRVPELHGDREPSRGL